MAVNFRVEMDNFFSQAGVNAKPQGFETIGLNNDEMKEILGDRNGLTDALQRNFPDLCYRDKSHTKPKAFMQALFVWELYGRKSTVAELSEALGVKYTSIPQYMYVVRDALNIAFGLDIVCEGDTYKLMSMDDLQQRSDHLVKALETYGTRMIKVARAVNSLEKCGYGDHPQLVAARSATSSIATALMSLAGEIKNPELKALAATAA